MTEKTKQKHSITGIIEKTSEKESEKGKRYGIKLKSKQSDTSAWFNGFGELPDSCEEGNIVKITFTANSPDGVKYFRNITDVDLLEQSNTPSSKSQKELPEKQESNTRESTGLHIRIKAVECISRLYNGSPPENKEEFTTFMNRVKRVEKYIRGGRDVDE